MLKLSPIGPLKNKKDLSALLDILAPTFNFTRAQGDGYSKIVGEKNYRVIRAGRTIAGGCALLPMGQFFGGKSVPMMGVAAVGIAPEYRGQGTATALMQGALREMRTKGWPISSLYPATLPLYRSVGYEQAGTRFEIRIPAKMLIYKQRVNDLEIRRITASDEQAIRQVYRTRAERAGGNLDRSDFIWHRVKSPRGRSTQGFMALNPRTKEIEGYTFYDQKESPDAPYSLHLTDLVALTPAAGRRLLAFLADHRSMTDQIIYTGSADDPILKLLPERNYSARLLDHWMLRIVNVSAALKARGYPSCVNAEIHLEVQDDSLPENTGRYVLTISNGKPKVHTGGRGDIRIDARGLAALYTGHMSPNDLRITGQISIAPRAKDADTAMNVLAGAFAGPAPWLGDMF